MTMKTAVLAMALLLTATALPSHAQAPALPDTMMKKLMAAVEENDYAAFVEDGIPEFKTGVTPQILERVSRQIAERLKEGYECAYLGEMKQREFKVYLWKATFKDGGDDALIKLVVRDDLVAGFWIQ